MSFSEIWTTLCPALSERESRLYTETRVDGQTFKRALQLKYISFSSLHLPWLPNKLVFVHRSSFIKFIPTIRAGNPGFFSGETYFGEYNELME